MARMITFSRYLLVAAILGCSPLALAAGGYEGLIAPADKSPSKAEEAPGYSGVIAGPTADPEEEYTPEPGSVRPRDLRSVSAMHGIDQDGDDVPDAIQKRQTKANFSNASHKRVEGKLPAEYAIEQNIQEAMDSINDEDLSSDERVQAARAAYKGLSKLADGLRRQQRVPDRIYKQIGVSDAFISDERAGNSAALARLDVALANLKPYQ